MTHPLLTPRYMVEADYPNSRYTVGQVIDATSDDIVSVCDKYPKIFRPMHWWEARELGEMPRWVRFGRDGKFRIACGTWSVVGDFMWFDDSNGNSFKLLDWVNITTPATEAEYLEYLKSKEK